MEQQRPPKLRYYTDPNSWTTHASITIMIMSMVLRGLSYWGVWSDPETSNMDALLYIGLPEFSALLFILTIALLGKHRVWPSFIPVWGLCAFLVLDARLYSDELSMLICVVAYVLIAILYFCTVVNILSTKWVLAVIALLPFLYHILVLDIKALQDTEHPVLFTTGVRELSVLCMLLSLLFIALAMKKKETSRKAKTTEAAPVPQPEPAPVVEQAPPVLSWDTNAVAPAAQDMASPAPAASADPAPETPVEESVSTDA